MRDGCGTENVGDSPAGVGRIGHRDHGLRRRVTNTVRSVVLTAMRVRTISAGLVTQLAHNPRPDVLTAAALIRVCAPVI